MTATFLVLESTPFVLGMVQELQQRVKSIPLIAICDNLLDKTPSTGLRVLPPRENLCWPA